MVRIPHPERMEIRISANMMALAFSHKMSQEKTPSKSASYHQWKALPENRGHYEGERDQGGDLQQDKGRYHAEIEASLCYSKKGE